MATSDLVPGDILSLESGDIVPADCILLQERNFKVDETTFTGESISVTKTPVLDKDEEITDENRLLQGVIIVSGNAFAEIIHTGVDTKLAQIAKSASEVQTESDLVKGITESVNSF